jgi:hypothetical protein
VICLAKNSLQNNDTEEHDSKEKLSLFVKVDEDARAIIDKYKDMGIKIAKLIEDAVDIYDDFNSLSPEIKGVIEKYQEKEESLVSFLERAVKFYADQKNLDRDLWMRAREEMKMMLIGKTTFNQLIHAAELPQDARERPYRKNVALDLILWDTGKPLKNLKIEEIITTVQKIWRVANYFYDIVVHQKGDEYHLLFKHRQNKRYSEYWLGYFTSLFESEELACKCSVEGQVFDETISMTIKIRDEKEE